MTTETQQQPQQDQQQQQQQTQQQPPQQTQAGPEAGTKDGQRSPAYDPLKELADALRDQPVGEAQRGAQQSKGSEGGEAGAKPKNLTELAEKLSIKVDDLYGLEIPSKVKDAEPYTLGKLKDLAAEHDAFTIRTLNFEQEARAKEAELNRFRGELRLLLSGLPENALNPEVMGQLRARYTEQVQQERTRLLEAVPEWQDNAVEERERGEMQEHLVDHGFPKNALDTITDHGLLKYVRTNMMREKRIAAALKTVTERMPGTQGRSQRTQQTQSGGGRQPPAPRQSREQQRVSAFMQTIQDAANP